MNLHEQDDGLIVVGLDLGGAISLWFSDTTPEAPCFHGFVGFWRSIMERPEPLIERHHSIGIVHLEILVMQVVRKVGGVHTGFLTDDHPVESRMTFGRRKA